MFQILEYQKITTGKNELTLLPDGANSELLTSLLAAEKVPTTK
jgi:hypothetical protein